MCSRWRFAYTYRNIIQKKSSPAKQCKPQSVPFSCCTEGQHCRAEISVFLLRHPVPKGHICRATSVRKKIVPYTALRLSREGLKEAVGFRFKCQIRLSCYIDRLPRLINVLGSASCDTKERDMVSLAGQHKVVYRTTVRHPKNCVCCPHSSTACGGYSAADIFRTSNHVNITLPYVGPFTKYCNMVMFVTSVCDIKLRRSHLLFLMHSLIYFSSCKRMQKQCVPGLDSSSFLSCTRILDAKSAQRVHYVVWQGLGNKASRVKRRVPRHSPDHPRYTLRQGCFMCACPRVYW